jgi:hypothetical protein
MERSGGANDPVAGGAAVLTGVLVVAGCSDSSPKKDGDKMGKDKMDKDKMDGEKMDKM